MFSKFRKKDKRRHSVPETVRICLPLATIIENEGIPSSTKSIRKMSIQSPPTTANQAKSPREKRFTFFRTRTASGASDTSSTSSSPKLSPRSLFDRVKSRLVPSSANSSSNSYSNNDSPARKLFGPPSSRKRLSHSISEDHEGEHHCESNYKTFHGLPTNLKTNLAKINTSNLTKNLKNLHVEEALSIAKMYEPPIENHQLFAYFMKHKCCYDIMPKSAKIVVFDTQLLVKKAFYALIYNGVRAAPLWDSKNQKFVGMLTITDFILILQKYYRQPNAKIEELEEQKIVEWRDVLKEYQRPLVWLKPEDTLFDCIQILTENRVHRLPIIDSSTGNVLCIITHKRILRFLYLYIYDMPQPEFLQKSIEELSIGTFKTIQTINVNTPIIEALNIFVATRVSALPVVDESTKLVNIYSKFDVIDLAAEKSYNNLNLTVTEALQYRKNRFEGVASCFRNESLGAIMERIVNKEVHRLVIIDEKNHVQGIVSLSDILSYIILKQDSSYVNKHLSVQVNSMAAMDDDSQSSFKEGSVFYDDMMMETDGTK